MKILETERLVLREWQPEDVTAAALIYADPEVMRYIGKGQPYSLAQTERGIMMTIEHYRRYGFGVWAMLFKVNNNEIIGHCGLKYWPEFGEVEVGYLLAKAYWGQGIASEAARAVLNYGFTKLEREQIISIAQPANHASTHVMQKLGLTFDRETTLNHNTVAIYKITKNEYILFKNLIK